MAGQLVDPVVFVRLQEQIDDDTQVRDQIRDIVQELEKAEKVAIAALSNAYSAPNVAVAIQEVETKALPVISQRIAGLAAVTNPHPYYKFNTMWTRQMQDAAFVVLLMGWFGGFETQSEGGMMTIEEVGKVLSVTVDVGDDDVFHLTIEEYLHALVTLVDELARVARNSVTLGNFVRPVLISRFVKDVHAGFQVLNLKNDSLRRRSDSIKYKVRECEDIMYDLTLRDLLPK